MSNGGIGGGAIDAREEPREGRRDAGGQRKGGSEKRDRGKDGGSEGSGETEREEGRLTSKCGEDAMVLWFANARGPTRRFLSRVFKASRVMALWTRVKTQEKDLRVGTRHTGRARFTSIMMERGPGEEGIACGWERGPA